MEYGDPGIAWGEANAASDDGEAVMRAEREACATDADLEAQAITALVKRWPLTIRTARKAVNDARQVLGELRAMYDVELCDGPDAADAEAEFAAVVLALGRAHTIASRRLKLVEDEEKDAELARLRARNADLEQQLTDRRLAEDAGNG